MNFAIIKTGGKQYKVRAGETLKIEKLEEEEGAKVSFDEVLLISDEEGKDVQFGAPFIKDAKVEGKVLRHGRYKKIVIFKYKPKKRYSKKAGHRQDFTEIEVTKV